jgi:glycosyltransferase involved in cell wall biosynthesis
MANPKASNDQGDPCISVVTVVFNGFTTIENTIQSVLNQKYQNFEYIIIDGGSTDGTVDILKRYESRISIWVSEPDRGIYDAMNKALDLARGEYIIFLGCDDVLYGADVLMAAASKMINRNLVYYGNVIMKKNGIVYDGSFDELKITKKNICHQAIFYPRCLYSTNKYSLNYPLLSDYEYNLRLFKRFVHLDLIISIFDDSGISSQKCDLSFKKDFHALVIKHLGFNIYTTMMLRSAFRLIKRGLYRVGALIALRKGVPK